MYKGTNREQWAFYVDKLRNTVRQHVQRIKETNKQTPPPKQYKTKQNKTNRLKEKEKKGQTGLKGSLLTVLSSQ